MKTEIINTVLLIIHSVVLGLQLSSRRRFHAEPLIQTPELKDQKFQK